MYLLFQFFYIEEYIDMWIISDIIIYTTNWRIHMFKVWGKVIKNNKIIESIDITDTSPGSQKDKFKKAIEKICYKLDLSTPLWLIQHDNEFRTFKRATFSSDDFVEDMEFDKLEVDLISTDEKKQ